MYLLYCFFFRLLEFLVYFPVYHNDVLLKVGLILYYNSLISKEKSAEGTLKENLKNETNSICYDDKINLVLDIDETLVYSKIDKELKKDETNINDIYEDSPKDDIYYIRLESIDKVFIYKIQVRKNMADFLFIFINAEINIDVYAQKYGKYLYNL